MLKSVIKGAVALSVFVSSLSAFAGGDIGNGGGAIVCRNSAGEVQQAWMLDLWEAENLPLARNGMQPLRIVRDESHSVNEQVTAAIAKLGALDPVLSTRVQTQVDQVRALMSTLPIQMRRINDSNDFATPRIFGLDCQREQLANFTDLYGLIVSQDIYEKLPKTDQAALILHEAIYKLDREQSGARTTSDGTRAIVGYLFSETPLRAELFSRSMLLRCKSYDAVIENLTSPSEELFSSFSVRGNISASGSGFEGEICRTSPFDLVELNASAELVGLWNRRLISRRRASRSSFEATGRVRWVHRGSGTELGRLELRVTVPVGDVCWDRGYNDCTFDDFESLSFPFGPGWDRLP